MSTHFADRAEAGRALGPLLIEAYGAVDAVVLGLPRGGVPVAAAVARVIGAPVDVFVVRKLGVPSQPELAFGAVAGGGVRVLNPDIVADAGLDAATLDRLTAAAAAEIERRELSYRRGRPALELAGRTVILVDDGIATGASVRAAVEAVRAHHPAAVVVAAPVAPAAVAAQLAEVADRLVVLVAAAWFDSVGSFYDDFTQLTDADVEAALRAAD